MNPVGWFEIPVTDKDRAVQFYNAVFGFDMEFEPFGPLEMAFFPFDEEGKGASGSLIHHPDWYKPGQTGPLIYFSCEDVGPILENARSNGGEVQVEKRLIAEDVGYVGVFVDTEGNRVAVHSRK